MLASLDCNGAFRHKLNTSNSDGTRAMDGGCQTPSTMYSSAATVPSRRFRAVREMSNEAAGSAGSPKAARTKKPGAAFVDVEQGH
jgi:hypothetical protein